MKSLDKAIPDYTENSLRRMINGLDQLSNKVVAENEKAILDSINVLVRDSGNFDSQEDFDNVWKVLDDLDNNWIYNNQVVKSNVNAYKTALKSTENNFVANTTITDAVKGTRTKLEKLNQETSKDLPAILDALNLFTESHLTHANSSVLKLLEDEKDEIRDAIWVADRLNRMDIDSNDPGYNLSEDHNNYKTGLDFFLNGDHKEARKYLNREITLDERTLFQNAGTSHRGKIEIAVNTLRGAISTFDKAYNTAVGQNNDDVMEMITNIRSKGLFSHMQYIPKTGAFKINQNNLDTRLGEWDTVITKIMNDNSIKWNGSEGKQLKAAFKGAPNSKLIGIQGIYDKLEELVAYDLRIVQKDGTYDSRMIPPADLIQKLNETIDWTPQKWSSIWPWAEMEEEITGINFTASQLFMDILNVHRDLNLHKTNIAKFRGTGVTGDYGSNASGLFDFDE